MCTHTCAHTHVHTHVHAHVHTYTCTHMCTHIQVHIHVHTHTQAHTHTRAHTHTHAHTYMCTHTYKCICKTNCKKEPVNISLGRLICKGHACSQISQCTTEVGGPGSSWVSQWPCWETGHQSDPQYISVHASLCHWSHDN